MGLMGESCLQYTNTLYKILAVLKTIVKSDHFVRDFSADNFQSVYMIR